MAPKKKSLEEKKQELESTTRSRNTKKKTPQSELRIIKKEQDASEDVGMPNDIPADVHELEPQKTLVPDFKQSS